MHSEKKSQNSLELKLEGPTPLLLLAEQIPIIQPLHIHQEMVDQREIGHADDGRNQNVKNRLTHNCSPPQLNETGNVNSGVQRPSAGALYAGKPIEEPQTDGNGDVENHLADLDLDFTVLNCCRGHRVSFS